jgi:thymidine kinase
MFSGKTEELIRRLKEHICQTKSRNLQTIDTRYDEEMVVSHDANEIRSTPVPQLLILLFWRKVAM